MPQHIIFSHNNATHDTLAERSLATYIDEIKLIVRKGGYESPESAVNCPGDMAMHKEVMSMVAKKVSDELRFIVVVGIGGSNLGTKAVYEAVAGIKDGLTDAYPKILFLDTVSARSMMDVVEILTTQTDSKEQFLINVVTKSGTTTETIANFETIYDALSVRLGNITDRVVITTDRDSVLWKAAGKGRIARLAVPKQVGGRFSALSAVGQFPLACAGIDVRALLKGATDMLKRCTQKTNNPAVRGASIIYHYRAHNVRMHNIFFFNPELESLGKWHRQLMSESLGKKENDVGTTVREGIVPFVSIGSTDLHSMAQMYLGGPQEILTTFVYAKQMPTQVKVPSKLLLGALVKDIKGVSFKNIMAAIYEGTKSAYTQHELPFMEAHLARIDEYAVGQYMQWKMCEMMLLGRLLNINAFNQPNVEDYKKVTRGLLGKKS